MRARGPAAIALLAVATGAIGFLVHVTSLGNDFVWDDSIVLRRQLPAFHSLGDVFFPPPNIPSFGQFYYRPVVTLTYLADLRLWGDSPFGFHLPVVLLHAINCVLVFLLGRRLFGAAPGGILAASAGAILFATHPIHTESVCWMAGRSDVLATLFVLAAILAYFAWRQAPARRGQLVLACALFLLACLSKEVGLSLVVLVVVADVLGVVRGEREGRGLPIAGWVALAATAAVYLFLRSRALASEPVRLQAQNPDLVASALNLVRATGFYLSRIVAPVHLQAYVPEMPAPDLSLAIGFFGLVVVSASLAYALKKGERRVAWLIVWFFAALVPSLAITWYRIAEAAVAERYLYLPSVGFCLLVGYLVFVTLPRRALGAGGVVVAALAVVYTGGTLERAKVWKSDLEFWGDAVAKSPDDGLPHLHLGLAYATLNQNALAEEEYLTALRTRLDAEGRATASNNLGMLHLSSDPDKADGFFEQAIRFRPDYATPYYGLGVTSADRAEAALRAGRSEEGSRLLRRADTYLERAIALNPSYVKAMNQLAFLYFYEGRRAEAAELVARIFQHVSSGPEYERARRTQALLERASGGSR